jgi:protein-disulfide isomerase
MEPMLVLQARHRRRSGRLLLAALVATLCAACGGAQAPPPAEEADTTLIAEAPQQFLVLGDAEADARLTVYAELSDYAFLRWAATQLPALVRGPVASSRLAIDLRPLPGRPPGGEDATDAGRAALAAAAQDRLWSFVAVLASTYVGAFDEPSLQSELSQVQGLDVRRALRDRTKPAVDKRLRRAEVDLQALGARAPLAVLQESDGGEPQVLPLPTAGSLRTDGG